MNAKKMRNIITLLLILTPLMSLSQNRYFLSGYNLFKIELNTDTHKYEVTDDLRNQTMSLEISNDDAIIRSSVFKENILLKTVSTRTPDISQNSIGIIDKTLTDYNGFEFDVSVSRDIKSGIIIVIIIFNKIDGYMFSSDKMITL